jgi:hypothetical protein
MIIPEKVYMPVKYVKKGSVDYSKVAAAMVKKGSKSEIDIKSVSSTTIDSIMSEYSKILK